MDVFLFAMLCIALLRSVGCVVVIDYYLRLNERIFLWIAGGWLIYALSPLFNLLYAWSGERVFDFLYMSLALEGVLFLTSGALWLFRKFDLRRVAVGGLLFLAALLGLYALGARQVVAVMVPGLQFLTLAVVSIIAFVGRKAYTRVGGSSIYWLLAIFLAGAAQAFAYIFTPPSSLPVLVYTITVLINVLIIIFFMHLQHNISLMRQKESEALYRLIVENQSDLIVKLDMLGRFLYANPKYCALFDTPLEQLLGKAIPRHTYRDLGLDESPSQARRALYHEPYACYVEERTETAYGWRWLAWSEKTVFDADHKMAAIVAVGRDISEQKEAGAEVRRLNQELEQRVSERTAQLEALNKELETFTYSVSHDLKAPLRGIDGFSRILLDEYADKLGGEGRHYLENISASVRHMRALIDDLLAYARLERRALVSQKIDLAELVDEILAEHKLELEQNGAQLSVDLAGCELVADRENLRQALGNLIDNAIKYSRQARPPRIELGCERSQTRLRLWVRDNGIGFDMEYQHKIFELFQRLHGQDEYAGTGVGLAIVQKAVQRMGGQISVQSAPGQGSTFTLELPV
jgi:PAS domain S-box-containing protein